MRLLGCIFQCRLEQTRVVLNECGDVFVGDWGYATPWLSVQGLAVKVVSAPRPLESRCGS